ncbi:hypothetical protein GlitD10_0300 [Gloeomargarita lithophora Alchichica-D10]|uniref:RiboL-PSP-HEPN domain-containing protein n=1 Tax=Gloeomargarita lithophora Alchichica-D10 TaxID=1188229 RepID=A0A1J0A9K9_9CYAN|nr:hypothetical protein [Gloeomargarita lithophora]APB32607.1 hypothetical protein GlitD10_0300 [Gloeomargarita lithophora Alchichica-D10]
MLSPRQIFEDNIRPADLLLKVFRLLEHESPTTEIELSKTLRSLINVPHDEGLIIIYNEIFLGLIRERAEVSPSAIKRSALCNLLRQAVVTASTALETYLPAILRQNLPEVIKLRGRDFIPRNDNDINQQFKGLTFSLEETVRILVGPDPLFIANKIISSLSFSYLSGARGIRVTALLLGLEKPWELIAKELGREEKEIRQTLEATMKRRNDIVHRADRSQDEPTGTVQEIGYPWAKQAVETIRLVCLALDDLVVKRLKEIQQQNLISSVLEVV